jgi:hypothetical protein
VYPFNDYVPWMVWGKREHLDLKLTPYAVLATSPDEGFVQLIESISLADVLAVHYIYIYIFVVNFHN